MENYFDVLELSIDDIQGKDETTIQNLVNAAHKRLYAFTIGSYAPVPRPDGKTQAQWQVILNNALKTLLDPQKRQDHIAQLQPDPVPVPSRTIIRFRNGDEATSIPQLITLMEKNASEATDILYQGYLEQGLAGAGETPFAIAAKAVVSQFSSNRSIGLMAMVAILRGKVKMHRGGEASNPKQLASLIDQNWEDAKTLLYNGFFEFWFEYTNQTQLAGTTKKITSTFRNEQDIGLEELIQRLDPQIGKPEPEVSHTKLDFGSMIKKSEKTIRLKIKNIGRGFLSGDVQIESGLPGLQISETEIIGDGVITVKLDASALKAKQTHKTSLIIDTNAGNIIVPISCYIDDPKQQAVQRIAISGFSVAAIALVARLIVQQFVSSGWLATGLTGAGFTDWAQHWNWVKWFEWPGFEWQVYTLGASRADLGFVIALTSLGAGVFVYWKYVFKKNRVS